MRFQAKRVWPRRNAFGLQHIYIHFYFSPCHSAVHNLDIMQCTILTNFNMQIALIVVIFHSFDTIIITIKVIILLDNLGDK